MLACSQGCCGESKRLSCAGQMHPRVGQADPCRKWQDCKIGKREVIVHVFEGYIGKSAPRSVGEPRGHKWVPAEIIHSLSKAQS